MTILLAATVLGISGSYFESRTCSIYAGPCHYSGEVMVDGATGVAAWSFENGSYKGAPLAGLKAAAVIKADENLSFGGARKSVLYLDSNANPRQRAALLAAVQDLPRLTLGKIMAVVDAKISLAADSIRIFANNKTAYEATTSRRECLACSMPGTLWYEPLSAGTKVSVATVEMQRLSDKTLGETWTRRDEAAAFVGTFSW